MRSASQYRWLSLFTISLQIAYQDDVADLHAAYEGEESAIPRPTMSEHLLLGQGRELLRLSA